MVTILMSRYTNWLKERVYCDVCKVTTARHFMMYVHIKSENHINAINHRNICGFLN